LFEHELDASTFGVPQKRRRLFIVGINRLKFPDRKFHAPKNFFRNSCHGPGSSCSLAKPDVFSEKTLKAKTFHTIQIIGR